MACQFVICQGLVTNGLARSYALSVVVAFRRVPVGPSDQSAMHAAAGYVEL